jgi:excisionase family DNA binding protein
MITHGEDGRSDGATATVNPMVVIDGEEYLTVEEAARLMDVKPATLYAYVSRGVLRSYRQGIKRTRLYRRAEIEGLLRLAPSVTPARGRPRRAGRGGEIPLAESWIRD